MIGLWGMIIYDIVGSGCLNGLFINNASSRNSVMNEIARKKDSSEGLSGEYEISWIEAGQSPTNGKLTITDAADKISYNFEWRVKNKLVFSGVGMQVGATKISVIYWEGSVTPFSQQLNSIFENKKD